MTNEELAKLDFPIATMKMLISTTAMLRTVLQNQMTIIKALNIGNQERLVAEINHLLQENLSGLCAHFPHIPPIGYNKSAHSPTCSRICLSVNNIAIFIF